MNRPTVSDFRHYARAFDDAPEPAAGGAWPEGEYHGCTIDVAMVRFVKAGNPSVAVAFTHPTRLGKVWKNLVLDNNPQRLGWIKKELLLMGFDLQRFREIADRIDEIEGNRCSIRVKHSGDFVNVYVLEPPPEEQAGAGDFDASAEDDDIPF